MSVLGPFAPSQFPYAKFLLALAIGLIGTGAFMYMQLPLPWMLGSMFACLVASLLRLPVAMPKLVSPPMLMIVGVMLGSGFTYDVLLGMGAWIPSLLALIFFIAFSATASILYLRYIAKFDFVTAFFAGVPGGLIEMVTLGSGQGGDTRAITLVHSSRILLIVLSLPIVLGLFSDSWLPRGRTIGISIFDTTISNDIWLLGTGIIGIVVGRLLKLQGPYLIGPMLVSAVVHVTDLSSFRAPYELIYVAQLVLGASLGCSFAGISPATVLRILAISVGSSAILACTSIVFALGLSHFTGIPTLSLLLAFSPGGLTETSLVALALNVEVGFVAIHHIVRVLVITMSAAFVFSNVNRPRRRGRSNPNE